MRGYVVCRLVKKLRLLKMLCACYYTHSLTSLIAWARRWRVRLKTRSGLHLTQTGLTEVQKSAHIKIA